MLYTSSNSIMSVFFSINDSNYFFGGMSIGKNFAIDDWEGGRYTAPEKAGLHPGHISSPQTSDNHAIFLGVNLMWIHI